MGGTLKVFVLAKEVIKNLVPLNAKPNAKSVAERHNKHYGATLLTTPSRQIKRLPQGSQLLRLLNEKKNQFYYTSF